MQKWNISPEELQTLYWNKYLNQREIAEKIGCSKSTIKVKMQKYQIPRRPGGGQPYPHYNFSIIPSKDLGYFCGLVIGDGYLTCRNRNYRIGIESSNVQLINLFCLTAKRICSLLHPFTYKRKKLRKFPKGYTYNGITIVGGLDSKLLYQILKPYKLQDYYFKIPNFLRTKESIVGFLQGIFDAEGSVDVRKSNSHVSLTSKHKSNLLKIQRLLQHLGIEAKIYSDINSCTLYIQRKQSLKIFKRLVNFRLNYKKEALKNAINSYKT